MTTISPGKTILARSTLKESFPHDFCVYDLNQLLTLLSLDRDSEIDFDDSNIFIRGNNTETKYRKTSKEMIISPPDKTLVLPSVEVSFKLSEENLLTLLKGANVLQSPHISVNSKNGKLTLTCFDAKNDSAHTRSISLNEDFVGDIRAVFLTENLKMIPGTYDVEISSKGLASFKNTHQELEYWIAIEAKESTFGV